MTEILSDGRTRKKHRAMILTPDEWPHMCLPLKRKIEVGGYQVATLRTAISERDYDRAANAGSIPRLIVDVNMTLFGAIGEVERVEYHGVELLLNDGWIVD